MSNNKCNRCNKFSRNYIKGIKRFNKTEAGWCCARREDVNAQGCCDKFETKKIMRKSRRSIEVCLESILTDLSAVRNIIEEERRENEEV